MKRQPERKRYYAGERVETRSDDNVSPCIHFYECTHPYRTQTTIVGYGHVDGALFYLIIHPYAATLTRKMCGPDGRYAAFNVGLDYIGKNVAMVPHFIVLGVSDETAKLGPQKGLFCAGPCSNYFPEATPDTDPNKGADGQWWCRTCRTDHAWRRESSGEG